MSANARVWRVYLDEAAHFDVDLVENIRDTVDVTLVFVSDINSCALVFGTVLMRCRSKAGLFSAVVSTLVGQTPTALQPNFGANHCGTAHGDD